MWPVWHGLLSSLFHSRARPEGTKGNYWNRNILWKFSILSISSASAATGAPQGPVSPAKRGRCARRNDNRVKKSLLVGSLGSSRAATVSGSLLHSVPPKEMMKGIIYAPQAPKVNPERSDGEPSETVRKGCKKLSHSYMGYLFHITIPTWARFLRASRDGGEDG